MVNEMNAASFHGGWKTNLLPNYELLRHNNAINRHALMMMITEDAELWYEQKAHNKVDHGCFGQGLLIPDS